MDTPNTAIVVAAIAAIVVACILRICTNKEEKKVKKKYHPIGGTIFHLLYNFRRLYDYLTDLTHQYTTFRILYHDNVEIYTSDPANVEYFLKTNFANYGKVAARNTFTYSLFLAQF